MFASSANSLKLQSWPLDVLQENVQYIPYNESKISHISWCNDNSYIALLQEHEKPEVINTDNFSNVNLAHVINISDASALVFNNTIKKNLAIGTKNGEIVVYDIQARNLLSCFPSLVTPVEYLEFNETDEQLGVLSEDTAVIFPTEKAEGDVNIELKHSNKCTALKFHPTDINRLTVGCSNGFVTLWDSKTSQKIMKPQLHLQSVTSVAMSSCGSFMVSSGLDRKICITDLNSGECQFKISLNHPATALDLKYDDKIIAVGLNDGSVYLYDMQFNPQPLALTRPHNSAVTKIKFQHEEREFIETDSQVLTTLVKENLIQNYSPAKKEYELDVNAETLQKVKTDLIKMIKIQAEELENQFKDQSQKFQSFINNEFKTINEVIKNRWEVFNEGDLNKIIELANASENPLNEN